MATEPKKIKLVHTSRVEKYRDDQDPEVDEPADVVEAVTETFATPDELAALGLSIPDQGL